MKVNRDPDEIFEASFDLFSRLSELKQKREEWELMVAQSITEKHLQKEAIEKLETEISQLEKKVDGSVIHCEGDEGKSFNVPQGTEWYDINIHFVDTEKVQISIGKGRKYERTYKTIGFFNKTTKKWKQAWMHLLIMTVYRGKPPNLKEVEDITPKHVSELGKELKRLFPGVIGNPFKTYTKEQGWEPKISLSYSEKIAEQYRP